MFPPPKSVINYRTRTKKKPLRRALRRFAFLVGLSTGNAPKLGLSPLGTVHETVLGHLAAQCEIPPHIAQYPFEIVSQRPYAIFSVAIPWFLTDIYAIRTPILGAYFFANRGGWGVVRNIFVFFHCQESFRQNKPEKVRYATNWRKQGKFPEFRLFSLKIPTPLFLLVTSTDFSEFSFCFQGKHPECRKVPHFRKPACESALLWFGLLGWFHQQCAY